jgi:uncharacterized membrane-anchored protein
MRLLLLACMLLAFGGIASAKPPQNDQEREAAIKTLTWRDGETLTLPLSRGTLQAPPPLRQLIGADAVNAYEINNGIDAPTGTEAMLYDRQKGLVFYQKLGRGYVRLDDWGDVDADAMLKTLSEDTEESNIKRRSAGTPPLHVVGWLERPHLDRATNTVRWAIEATEEGTGPIVNSVALVLGRDGFEKVTWIRVKNGPPSQMLDVALASFSFPAGGLYVDYRPGDEVADYGIASLVAAVVGVKMAAKLGFLAALLVFAKKFGVLLLIPIGLFAAWKKRLFSRKNAPP